jgi:hypothetical protein
LQDVIVVKSIDIVLFLFPSTLETQGQAMRSQTTPHAPYANKNNSIRVQEEKLRGGGEHTLAYANKNWQKGERQQKKKKKDIYIYFITNLILILIPILTSPKPKTLIF